MSEHENWYPVVNAGADVSNKLHWFPDYKTHPATGQSACGIWPSNIRCIRKDAGLVVMTAEDWFIDHGPESVCDECISGAKGRVMGDV